jgi:hypothetical protein
MSIRLIQDLHAAISRRDWTSTEIAANFLRDDIHAARKTLVGTQIGSLPDDYTMRKLADDAMSTKSRWRVFESISDRTHFGIELEDAGNDDDPILYSMKIRRETVQAIVDAHNAALAPAPTK